MRSFELEADQFACEALRNIEATPGAFFEGLFILFSMLRLCEDRAAPSIASTHPAASERFKRCIAALGGNAPRDSDLLERMVGYYIGAAQSRLEWQDSFG